MLLVLSLPSYCYSDTLEYGTTNNAASNGLTWNMQNVLPAESGLSVNGLIYQYSVTKDPNADMTVTIENDNALGDGYILQHTDDWSNYPGTTLNNILLFPSIPGEYWGDGRIRVEGEGQVNDPSVIYSYALDPCYIPLSDPSCPGYDDARYQWLLDNELLNSELSPEDPFYDEWVQLTLNNEVETEEEADIKEEENEEDEEIKKLNADATLDSIADSAQQAAIMNALSSIPNFETYYVTIPGGEYDDVIKLNDATLPDNERAMKNLSVDSLHRSMVRSQYDD